MNALLERLSAPRSAAKRAAARLEPLVLDGGLGSMLIARGLRPGEAPERWTVERPEEVSAVHRQYVEAGSEAVHANTFGANPIRLASFGLAEQCRVLNEAAVELVRRAGARFVVGDVGPTGEYLPPVGQGSEARWREAFAVQGAALAAAGPDALHVETMSDVREALVALEALRESAPGVPVLVSLTFERKKRGFFTIMGNPVGPTLLRVAQAGAAGVGANCSMTSDAMRELVVEAIEAIAGAGLDVPVVAQPNAGQPRVTPAGVSYDQSPEAFAADAVAMVRSGVRAIGGCCGTDPRFVRALCRQLAGREGAEA